MWRVSEYASMMMVTWPGVSRNSIGYGCPMIPGMPGGRQLAVWLSCCAFDIKALLLASYSGVSESAGRRGDRAAPDLVARGVDPPKGISQTPVKSGSLATAAQWAAVVTAILNVY